MRYIHLNPVRAGIVDRAEDYVWSALGAAAQGDTLALKGLSLVGIRMENLSLAKENAGCRDRRLSNGVVLGGRGFVECMSGRFEGLFQRRLVRIVAFVLGGTGLFATHGQRSAPKAA